MIVRAGPIPVEEAVKQIAAVIKLNVAATIATTF
jgi:hypothetical protein